MRVTSLSSSGGRLYSFYRSTESFDLALKPLIPFLLKCRADVFIGPGQEDRNLKLRIGPIAGDSERELLRLIRPFLQAA